MRRVVVTGIGLVTGLGVGADATWQGLLAGHSAIARLRGFDPSSLHTQLGVEIDDFDPRRFADRRAMRLMTRHEQLAVAAASLAITDADVDLETVPADRIGLFVAGNKEVSDPTKVSEAVLAARQPDGTASMALLAREGIERFYPLFYVEGLQGAAQFYISAAHGMRGPNAYFHGTADAGATAIGRAFRAVRRGEADLAVAGAADDPVSWWPMSKMDGLGVLTDRNDLGAQAFKPYDRQRSGSVFGEGAAYLVVEEREAAHRRQAHAYAEIVGVGGGHDASGLLTPHETGRGLVAAVSAALRDANGEGDAGAIDYVAAHGCATHLGDPSETRALRTVFGADADRLMASSVKPATGHLVGAAGALNVGVAALALDRGAVPPTLHLEDPDPACDLDWVPGEARSAPLGAALAVARGLEGQNVALALRKP